MVDPDELPPYHLAADFESGRVVYRWQCRRCVSGRGHAPRAELAIQAAEVHATAHLDDDPPPSDVWRAVLTVLVVLVAAVALLAVNIALNPGWGV
jgi:hypothetical protein